MNAWKKYLVKDKSDADLSSHDPDETGDFPDKEHAKAELIRNRGKLRLLQDVLYADSRNALLVVLQAMDAGGKDGTIKHIFRGVNPQGCTVTAFKVPTGEELKHDFLWRVHKKVPPLGMIGIFNRSHYEEVLVVRVHRHLSKEQLRERFRAINDFEQTLAENGLTILKVLSSHQQRGAAPPIGAAPRRSPQKVEIHGERFQRAPLLGRLSKGIPRRLQILQHELRAPWYVIPANKKWFRNVTIAQIVVHTLEQLDLKYPKPVLRNPPRFR